MIIELTSKKGYFWPGMDKYNKDRSYVADTSLVAELILQGC